MIALFITPGLLFFLLLICFPIAMSLYYSFTDWNGVSDYTRVGFRNYAEIFTKDSVFWRSMLNSLLVGVLTILIQHPLCIFLSMLIQNAGRFERPMRTILFIPSIISAFVTSQMWVSIFSVQFGLLNRVLEAVGLQSLQQDWLGGAPLAVFSIIFVVMWQGFGYGFLLYYSGLKGIPREVQESAMIDGATKFKYLLNIALPMITPVIRIAFVLSFVSGFKQIETVYLMTGGGPANQTQFMSMYLYSKAFREGLYGYGNAISILLVAVSLLITVSLNRLITRDVGEY